MCTLSGFTRLAFQISFGRCPKYSHKPWCHEIMVCWQQHFSNNCCAWHFQFASPVPLAFSFLPQDMSMAEEVSNGCTQLTSGIGGEALAVLAALSTSPTKDAAVPAVSPWKRRRVAPPQSQALAPTKAAVAPSWFPRACLPANAFQSRSVTSHVLTTFGTVVFPK